ncbi:MAG: endonuclease domain-containing protein [bacterium]|nr:endonuclease domain-containing protein [bacterium]
MRIHYKPHLKPLSRNLRKSGNLAEVLLWNEIKKDKLGYRFLRQRPIGNFIVDFYCSRLKLVIEIDGAATHDSKIEGDKKRQEEIETLGIRVIRFMDKDVRYNLSGVMERVQREILRLKIPRPLLQRGNTHHFL